MKKLYLLILLVFMTSISSIAQVTTSFDSGDEGWRCSGDQNSYWEASGGNPGGCFRVDDDAIGNMNRSHAPIQYLGDWSSSYTYDYISADIFLHKIWGEYITGNYVFKIYGPGGSAKTILPNPTPPLDSWITYTEFLSEPLWTIESGTWNELLHNVTKFIVTMEYIDGDEYCKLDNVFLSFTPIPVPIEPGVGYDFEWSIAGWAFENTGGVTLETNDGFPGQYVKILDEAGALSRAYPPSSCLGDWSLLDGHNAEIMCDYKITDINGYLNLPDYLMKISGPGGEATYPCPENISLAFDQWHSFGIPINESDWTIVNGNWQSLLDYVTELEIIVEFIYGDETVGIDNFYISNSPPEAGYTLNYWMATNLTIEEFESMYGKLVDQSHSAPANHYWDFGDGITSTEVNPEHLFMPGSHDVSLTVTNHFGSDTEIKENYIIVYPIDQEYYYWNNFDDSFISTVWDFNNGTWDQSGGFMWQTSNYYETGNYLGGCYAMVGSLLWDEIVFSCDIKSTDNDWMGCVFNWQDENNMYMFRWSMQNSIRILSKWVNGVETILASDNVPYQQNTWYDLEVSSLVGELSVTIDDITVFSVPDYTFTSGKAGLYCYGNQSTSYDNVIVKRPGKPIELKVFLSGAMGFSPEMKTTLLSEGYLPKNQPYNIPPWNYSESETAIDLPPNVVDWVLVEFRDAESAETATSATSIGRKAALLLSDGRIVSPSGGQPLLMDYEIEHNLYVCIHHRNHLEIMSSSPLEEVYGVYTYDFTGSPFAAYGQNAQEEILYPDENIYCMISGDINADGTIDNVDNNLWKINTGLSGYFSSDCDLDGQCDNVYKNERYLYNIGQNSQIPE